MNVLKICKNEEVKAILNRFILIVLLMISFLSLSAQEKKVTGVVFDKDSEPLTGVTVSVKNKQIGTISDIDGNFSLDQLTNEDVLIFSFIGFVSKEIKASDKSIGKVILEPDMIALDEVVAIGYGVARKKDLTGSVSRVSASDISKMGSSDLTQVLVGGIAGVNASLNTSAKGTGDLLIRGKTSLKANNSPLIVLDGNIYDGDISNINSSDIESIDILKDASSASVFGARSASGVIMITTKKGQKGKPVVNVNANWGVASLQKRQELFDVDGYVDMRMDYWESQRLEMPKGYYRSPHHLPEGLSLEQWRAYDENSPLSDDELWFSRNKFDAMELKNYSGNKSIDWFDEIFQTGFRQDYHASVSGASDNTNYYYSLGYTDNGGFLIGDQFKNFRTRINLDSKITDFLKIGVNAQYARNDQSSTSPKIEDTSYASPLGNIYNEDGTYKRYPHNDGLYENPYYYKYSDKYNVGSELFGTMYADITLPWGFSYRLNWMNNLKWNNDYTFEYTTDERTGKGGRRNEKNSYSWFLDNILSWKKTFATIHNFDFTLLYNVEKNTSWKGEVSNSNFLPNELLGYHQLGFGSNPKVSNDDAIITADALMARLNYALMDRYLFTASFRRDGYSVFGARNPWANFPSAAIAWRLTEEDFFKIDWINNLKWRLSYGINGNRDISTYLALAYLQPLKYIYQTDSGKQSFSGYYLSRMANKDLRWEETEAWNLGVDFSIFNGRLSGELEGYFMSTNNLILDRSLPSITGYPSITSNMGEIRNRGMEITLNTRNIDNKDLVWSTQFNFAFNRNKIKHLYGNMTDVFDKSGNVTGQKEADDYSNNWFIGEDIDRIYDYEICGVWQKEEEEEARKYGLKPGDMKVVDQNEDGKISSREDKTFLGYKTPRYRMSMVNNFTFLTNFDLSFLLNAQFGFLGKNNEYIHAGFEYGRMNRYKYPYWTPENPSDTYARLGSANPYSVSYYKNRSFVRLQNVSLAYRVPDKIIQPWKIQSLKFSVNMQNLFVISGWDYWDPETLTATPFIGTFSINITL